MGIESLSTFALIAAVLTLTPGADTVLVVRNTVRGGIVGGLASAGGICSGLLVHALVSSIGLAVLLAQSAAAFQAIRVAGALYLVWLGIQSLRRRGLAESSASIEPSTGPEVGAVRCFIEGLLTNLLNPKVVLFYLAILPQFVPPSGPIIAPSLLLAGIHALMGIVWLGVLACATAKARRLLRAPRARAMMDTVAGVVMICFGLRLGLSD